MKKELRIILLALIIITVIIYILPLIYCDLVLNTTRDYPEDEFLCNASDKKAIIVVAHDDDWYACVWNSKETV